MNEPAVIGIIKALIPAGGGASVTLAEPRDPAGLCHGCGQSLEEKGGAAYLRVGGRDPGRRESQQTERNDEVTMTTATDTDLAVPADHVAAELAVMRECAAAFMDRFAGGRMLYSWPPDRAHQMLAANAFGVPVMPVPDLPRRTVHLSAVQDQAARLTGTLWQAITFSGGLHTQTYRHFPTAIDPSWLTGLPLPSGQELPPRQPVALLDDTGPIERHLDPATLRAACAHRPRTRVFEDIGHNDDSTWPALTARHLTRLAGTLPVTCSVFESAHGDATLAAHQDAWFGVAVQVTGAKDWLLGEGPASAAQPPAQQVTTTAGDILLVPKHLLHLASTPANPGHSIHLTLTLDRDPPHPTRP